MGLSQRLSISKTVQNCTYIPTLSNIAAYNAGNTVDVDDVNEDLTDTHKISCPGGLL